MFCLCSVGFVIVLLVFSLFKAIVCDVLLVS